MIIKARYVHKPRDIHRCSTCNHPITGPHVYLWGYADHTPPQSARECLHCAEVYADGGYRSDGSRRDEDERQRVATAIKKGKDRDGTRKVLEAH